MEECPFCQIVRKEADAHLLYEDDQFIVLNSKYPAADTHLLFIPKKHVENISTVSDQDKEMLGALLFLASDVAKKQQLLDYKLIFNAGKYAKIPHLHLHLLAGNLEDNT